MSVHFIATRKLAHAALACSSAVGVIVVAACSSGSSTPFVGSPAVLVAIAGTNLNGTVGTQVGPFAVKVTDTAGTPIPNVTVNFTVSSGATLSTVTTTTDGSGNATTAATFGHVAGVYTVTATANGISTPLVFQTTANADVAATFTLAGGNNQIAPGGTAVGELLAVRIADQYNNSISGATVSWSAVRGILGTTAGHTAANGVSTTTFTLPVGTGASAVTANALGITITFTETGT
jgi:hypothetical protein